MRIMQC